MSFRMLPGGGVRIFSSASHAPSARRPTDLVLLVSSIVGIGLVSLVAPGPTALGAAFAQAVQAIPGLLGWFWEICYDLLLGWAVVLLIIAIVAHGRGRLLVSQLLACVFSLGFIVLAGELGGTVWSDALGNIWRSQPASLYPASRLALAAAVIVTASPHLSRPLRYVGRWVLFFGATASIALEASLALGVVAGLLVGFGSAALAHLLLGSPGGRLSLEQIDAALRDLGVEATDLRNVPLQPGGVALVEGADADGRPLLVKVYGRDAWDGQLITSTWAALSQRGQTPQLGGRLQRVEHEAFVTLLIERSGVPVMPVVAAGLAGGRDALLVIAAEGQPLASVEPESLDDALLAGLWDLVRRLGDLGVSHGALDAYRLVVRPDGSPAIADFGSATIAATDLALTTDRAQLLVTTALLVGRERAVSAAVAALGPEGLTEILPCIQPAILDRVTRHAIRERDWDLDDLRVRAAEAAGVELPELEQLRRVSWGSLLKVALIAFVAYTIISALAQVGLKSLLESFANADTTWLLGALVLAPITQIPQAFSTIGASIQPVTFGPVLMLQYAIQFIQLAVPSSAARIALEVRFFQRNGVTPTGALTIGAIDSVSGFLVQIVLILVITLSGLASLNLSGVTSSSSSGSSDGGGLGSIVMLIGIVALAGVVVILVVRPLRTRLLSWIPRMRSQLREKLAEASSSLRVLRHPSKVLMSLGGNFVGQFLQAVVLGMCLTAFGYHASLAQLLLINSAVSLFAGFMPVPGGMGVAEAAYTAAFVAIGVPNTEALSTAIAFRIVTYYLPPIWGGVAMRWLRQHAYI